MKNIFARIQKWWGGYVYEDDPDSCVFTIGMIIYPRPRIWWNKIKAHFKQNWKFWIGTLIIPTVLSLYFK